MKTRTTIDATSATDGTSYGGDRTENPIELEGDTDRWYFYVIYSEASRRHYTGIAKNPLKRLKTHNKGNGAKATRGKGPWKIIALCYAGNSRGQAQKNEARIRVVLRRATRKLWLEEHRYKEDVI